MSPRATTLPFVIAAACALQSLPAQAADAASMLQKYTAESGAAPDAARGQRFFTTRQGGEWSCASCHNAVPTKAGQHAGTGKSVAALAPGFNPERFTDTAKVEKWFRRNCKDVLSRECTAAEKADVLAWLMTFKP